MCERHADLPTHFSRFWVWNTAERILWPGLFRCIDTPGLPSNLSRSIERHGKRIHREHCDMIRGILRNEPDRLLEWTVQDGWEPLCKFLDRPVPEEPFPHVNDAVGFKGREKQAMELWFKQGFKNVALAIAVLVGIIVAWRFARS